MEERGRGAAVEQLTARGMEYQSPRWGAIGVMVILYQPIIISIPAMGGNSLILQFTFLKIYINPRNGRQ